MLLTFGSPKVLVADDDPDIGSIMAEVLQAEGYRVDLAASRLEVSQLVRAKAFSLVITDLFCSHVKATRLAWAATLRALAFPTPVGICTAWPVDVRLIENSGFAFFVGKPFELDNLITSAALALRAQRDMRPPRKAGGYSLAKREH